MKRPRFRNRRPVQVKDDRRTVLSDVVQEGHGELDDSSPESEELYIQLVACMFGSASRMAAFEEVLRYRQQRSRII